MQTSSVPVQFLGKSAAIGLALLFILSGCGGGGSKSSAPAKSGSVTVLIADGPALEFEHVYVEITKVSLLPADGGNPATIFEGSETVDLLEFRDEDFLLTTDDDVPAGKYEKIRLEIGDVQVVPDTDCPEVKLPSGKIDLNPRGAFEVKEGTAVFVRIDIDAKKSISIHQAGKSGKCIFRPVVFVDVRTDEVEETCPKEIAGTIVEIREGDDEDGEDHEWNHDDDDDEDDDDDDDDEDDHEAISPRDEIAEIVVDLGEDRGTVRVEVKSGTDIFDSKALPADLSALKVGDRVLVRGRLECDAEIEAIWIAAGSPLDLQGTVEKSIENGIFTLKTDVSSECRTTEGTLVFAVCDDDPLSPSLIQAGRSVRVIGASEKDGEVTFIRAAVVDLGPTEVRGQIQELNRLLQEITIRAGDADVEFRYDALTEIVLVGDGALSAEDLKVGQTVTASLEAGSDRAARIEVDPAKAAGEVENFDASSRTFILLEEVDPPPPPDTPIPEILVTVDPTATVILIVADGESSQVDLSELQDGDRVEIFGLVPSEGSFEARTVVIRR